MALRDCFFLHRFFNSFLQVQFFVGRKINAFTRALKSRNRVVLSESIDHPNGGNPSKATTFEA